MELGLNDKVVLITGGAGASEPQQSGLLLVKNVMLFL
ncbi:MAG: hypothetical protein Ct9H300mP28_32420 [Pseudomonadota bacterium]|nr:MAG: hypothetical protein Ct9H300mP28_32420 [Pseudomonadota bacterium]